MFVLPQVLVPAAYLLFRPASPCPGGRGPYNLRVLRGLVLGVARRPFVRKIATGGSGRRVALRFVAGESLDDAIRVIRELNAAGAEVSIDYLGENITDAAQASAATMVYLRALERIAGEGLRANLSLKLTQIGLDLDPKLAYGNAESIVGKAAGYGNDVTLDMEDHRYTERTIDTCLRLSGAHPGSVGIAIQAQLKRTPADLERLIGAGVHVRLCKGAYKEPLSLAFRRRARVQEAYERLATRLLGSGTYAMVATHDEVLIRHAVAEVARLGRAPGSYEFQMLYGVRRELQQRLVREGERLRVYVPFGDQWYPYLTRRIAERPANVRFFAEALLRK
jgi:proline dehydrogenase